MKIVKFNGIQLSNTALLSEVNSDGFVFVNDKEEEEVLSFETIREYFVGKTIKLKIDEVSKEVVE